MDPYQTEETFIPPNPIFSDDIKEKLKKHREAMLRRRSTDSSLQSSFSAANSSQLIDNDQTEGVICIDETNQTISYELSMSDDDDDISVSDQDTSFMGDEKSDDPFVKYYSTFGTDEQLAEVAKYKAKHESDAEEDGYMAFGDDEGSAVEEEQAEGVDALLQTLHDASPPGVPPWLDISPEAMKHRKMAPIMTRLHNEILDFCDYISPTEAEEALRRQVVQRVTEAVQFLWPEAEVKPFGSLLTGLYLPFADVDLVVIRKGSEYDQQRCDARQRSFLKNKRVQVDECDYSKRIFTALAKHMRAHGQITEVEIVAKARIPVMKFVDVTTGFKVDICLNVEGGVETGQYMLRAMEAMPALKPLTLVLKYFLQCRSLNETYSGGVGSFLLQCMLVAMLQRHPMRYKLTEMKLDVPDEDAEDSNQEKKDADVIDLEEDEETEEQAKKKKKRNKRQRDYERKQREAKEAAKKGYVADIDQHVNLGTLLYSFFDMYINQYNYFRVTLSIAGTGATYKKQTKKWGNPSLSSALSMENPVDTEHDVAANSFQIPRIRQAFLFALNTIQGAIRRSVDAHNSEPEEYTILQQLLPLCPELLQVRPAREWEDDEWEKVRKMVDSCDDVDTVRNANRREIFSTMRVASAAELQAMREEREKKAQALKEAQEKADAERKERKKANKQAKREREKAVRTAMIQQDLSRFDDSDEEHGGQGSSAKVKLAKNPVRVVNDDDEVDVEAGIVDFGKKAKKDTKKKEKKEKEKEKKKTHYEDLTDDVNSNSTSQAKQDKKPHDASATTKQAKQDEKTISSQQRVADMFGLEQESEDDDVVVLDVKQRAYDEGDGDSEAEVITSQAKQVENNVGKTKPGKAKKRKDRRDIESDDESVEQFSNYLPQSMWVGDDGETLPSDLSDVEYAPSWESEPPAKRSNKKMKSFRINQLKRQQQADGHRLVTLASQGQGASKTQKSKSGEHHKHKPYRRNKK